MTESGAVTEGGYTVTSSSETPEEIRAILAPSSADTPPDTSEAAAILGKKGGEAAAAKRAEAREEAKTAPETPPEAVAEPEAEPSEEQQLAEAEKLEKEGKLGKPRSDARAAMLDKARKLAVAKRDLEWERSERTRITAENAQLRAGQKPAAEPVKAAPEDAEPQEADFEDYKDFVKALATHTYGQAEKKAAKQSQERAYHEGVGKTVDSFVDRMNKAEAADATFHEKAASIAREFMPSFKRAQGEALSQIHVITDEIISSEHAPALTLHLAEHPDVFQRLKALRSPLEIQLAIAKLEGRIEDRLTAAPPAPAVKAVPSMANPPVRPVAGSPHTAETVPGEDSSYEEHRKYWGPRDRARQAQR